MYHLINYLNFKQFARVTRMTSGLVTQNHYMMECDGKGHLLARAN